VNCGAPVGRSRCLPIRDFDTIDSELRLLAAVRRSIREHGGEPSSRQVDERLDERLAHRDPSDSGRGDSCGLVAASMTSDGVVAVIGDGSAPLTSDQWAHAAVTLAADVGASEIAVEGFAARETYIRVVNDALRRCRRRIQSRSRAGRQRGRAGDPHQAAQIARGLPSPTSPTAA
jgi:hypothetical protein